MKKHKLLLSLLVIACMVFAANAEILTTKYGYLPFSKKEAISTMPAEEFVLVDAETNRPKYKGEPDEPLIDPVTGETVYRLNFTDQIRGGEYYLTVGDLSSDTIRIDTAAFNPVFAEAMKKITARRSQYGWLDDSGEENILLTSYVAARGLAYYEIFNDRFADGELEVPEGTNDVPDFLDELIYGVNGLLKWYREAPLETRNLDEATAALSVFGVAGRTLIKANPELAKETSEIARESYTYLSSRKAEIRRDLWLLFLAEMSLLTDKPEFEAEFREDLKTVLETGWATISSKDVTGLALGEMMKRSLENNDEIYESYMGRSVGLLLAQEKDPYHRAVAFEPIEVEFKAIYMESVDPAGLGSEGVYMIDLNEYYKTSVWARSAQDQLHYLLGRNREGVDYLEEGSLETVFHISLLSANFKDSSKITRSGRVIGGLFQITFWFVVILLGITLWQKYSAKKEEKIRDE